MGFQLMFLIELSFVDLLKHWFNNVPINFELLLTSVFDSMEVVGLDVQLKNPSNRINSETGLTNNLIIIF